MLSPNKVYSTFLRTFGPSLGNFLPNPKDKSTPPIFIVGTGRCGSTLLVNILNSHPQIIGYPGEANYLWHPKLFPADGHTAPIEINPKDYSISSVSTWPANHSDHIKSTFNFYQYLAGKDKRFFVKSAMISFLIPKILTLYPNAKFIHLFRNAPSVVESYFKKNFGKYEHFNYSEQEYYKYCGKYWNACIHEIEQVKKDYELEKTNRFLEFSYERLCSEPKRIVADLAEFFEVDLAEFEFDLSQIHSKNYKAGEKQERIMQLIGNYVASGMKLKGYHS